MDEFGNMMLDLSALNKIATHSDSIDKFSNLAADSSVLNNIATYSATMSFEVLIVVLLCSIFLNNALLFICANKDDGNSFAVVVNISNIEIRRCTLNKEFERCVRRHIVGGANRILISVLLPPRLCSTGTCRRLSAE